MSQNETPRAHPAAIVAAITRAAQNGAVIGPSTSLVAIAAMRALDNGAQIGGGIAHPGAAVRAAIRHGIERAAPIIAARNARIEAEQQPLREEIERATCSNSGGRVGELEAENDRLRATITAMAGRN